MKMFVRLPALPAACILLLLVATSAGIARAENRDGPGVTRAMSRDNPALVRAAVSQMFGVRPRARQEGKEVAAPPEKLDAAAIDAVARVGGSDDHRCLAEAIYFESRGEPLDGQVAVAEVVLNRVDDRRFPGTVCGVTNQGAGSGRGCQFSYACDGRSDVMKSTAARIRAEKLAALMLGGHPRIVADGATYFHTRSVRPSWARKMTRTTAIGHHYFYRPATQVASN
jgi:spore germination cell wall hydrolase CwlJ-like protein